MKRISLNSNAGILIIMIIIYFSFFTVALVNSQVLLKGCETKGYVIMSAAKAEILKKIHRPVWKDRTLVSKTSWVGSLECMQYYATVSANDSLDGVYSLEWFKWYFVNKNS